MGHKPPFKSQRCGKVPKSSCLILKLNTPHFPKTQYTEISGVTGKIIREMLDEYQVIQLKYLRAETYPLFIQPTMPLAEMQLVKDTKWL